jgi:membrane-bound lytic murein transglycosylase MltF
MKADAKDVARELLTEHQFKCFTQLMGKESHWNPKAKNPTSTAAGVGQLLKSTYRNLGMKHSNEAVPQTVAALAYIGRKYGSGGPCKAWQHFQRKNWY